MKVPRRTGSRNPSATREVLMSAGERLFAEHGFDGARVDQIAREARVNKAMVSYHFGGKEGLYAAILEAGFTPLRERLAALHASGAPAPERLREWIHVFSEAFGRRPTMPAMILREAIAGGARLEKHGVPYLQELLATIREVVDQGVESRAFRPVDPFLTHLALVGSLCFFSATTRFRERLLARGKIVATPPSLEGFTAHLEELFVRGLAEPGARARSRAKRGESR